MSFSLRLEYRKQGDLRFLSHLDVMGVMERALRRSGLPVAYTGGFNPRPKVASDPALPLGYESEGEGLQVTFEQVVPGEHVAQELNGFLPAELHIVRWREVTPGAPGRSGAEATRYELSVEGPVPTADEVRAFLAQDSVPVELARKGKVDLRPHVRAIELRDQTLVMTLSPVAGRTVRPEQVLAALRGTPVEEQTEAPVLIRKLADPTHVKVEQATALSS